MGGVAVIFHMCTHILGLNLSGFQLTNKQLSQSVSLLLPGGDTSNIKSNSFQSIICSAYTHKPSLSKSFFRIFPNIPQERCIPCAAE